MRAGRADPAAEVVLASADRSKWRDPTSRFVRATVVGEDGSFNFGGVLPGVYRVAAKPIGRWSSLDDDGMLQAELRGAATIVVHRGAAIYRDLAILR